MRLSDRLVLQAVDDHRLVLVDDSSGAEVVLSVVDAGRLAAGIAWFATNGGPALADALTGALADATVINARRPR
jgi:hypothetical protein